MVNGKKLAYHAYGYTEFTVDISNAVREGENTVAVLVDNSLEPNCRWYSGSGIYRPVHLIIKSRPLVGNVRIITKSYSPAIIEVRADAGDAAVEIYDGEKLLASGVPGELEIPGARLWDAENPSLYTCVVKTSADEERISFGIRKIEWSAKTGLLTNGVETLLRGGCVHHDNGILGACAFADAEERRVRIMKEAGYNAIRSSHNPCSRAMLDACDKLGMYMMDEAFDGWYTPKTHHDYARDFDACYRQDLEAMVHKDINHPSVIMYSIGNEVTETAQPRGIALTAEMKEFVHKLDGSRPVTCGINAMLNLLTKRGQGIYRDSGEYKPEPLPDSFKHKKEKKTGSALFNAIMQNLNWLTSLMSKSTGAGLAIKDAAGGLAILGLNYGSSRYDKDVADYPDRMIVGSETLFSELPYNWERVKRHPAIIGDFVWTAWDYLGEAGIGDWAYLPRKSLALTAGCGGIDLIGTVGAESFFQKVVWGKRRKPYICVHPVNRARQIPASGRWRFTNGLDSWNWQSFEGEKAIVEVFCNADRIGLFLNGRKIGIKSTRDMKAQFSLPYEQGILEAVAYDSGDKVLSSSTLASGKSAPALKVTPEKTVLRANGQDLYFAYIEVVDENGAYYPARDTEIRVRVEGAGALQALGNADCSAAGDFSGDTCETYQGHALAVIRASYEQGDILISVSAKGLGTKSFTVQSVAVASR